jgi:hypothetical protein
MRSLVFTIVFLVLPIGVQAADPLCVGDRAQMPAGWRPSVEQQKSLSAAPWSQREAEDASAAVKSALDEMIGHFEQKPEAVRSLWDDSVEALIQVTYASVNDPALDRKARDAARANLTALVTPYLDRDPKTATCEEFEALLPLAIFAHRFYPADDGRIGAITGRTNAAFRTCGSLATATGSVLEEVLTEEDVPSETAAVPEQAAGPEQSAALEELEDLFDLYLWSVWLIEAELYPDIELPAEAREFAPQVWDFFAAYRLEAASEFETAAEDPEFLKIADLATHIAHIPTGVHRFPLYVADFPGLYRFHRENFYGVMQSGDQDLFASFVDTLRQYGCTPENDAQVRDGTRHLLKSFHDSSDRWMRDQVAGAAPGDYGLIHRPWTAILGLRDRQPERPRAGTYGGVVRRWLPAPQPAD